MYTSVKLFIQLDSCGPKTFKQIIFHTQYVNDDIDSVVRKIVQLLPVLKKYAIMITLGLVTVSEVCGVFPEVLPLSDKGNNKRPGSIFSDHQKPSQVYSQTHYQKVHTEQCFSLKHTHIYNHPFDHTCNHSFS